MTANTDAHRDPGDEASAAELDAAELDVAYWRDIETLFQHQRARAEISGLQKVRAARRATRRGPASDAEPLWRPADAPPAGGTGDVEAVTR